MSDDIAFKIQLGLVLPKLDDQLSQSLTTIIEEIMAYLKQGTLAGQEPPSLEDVKVLFMQDLEIFLDSKVLPGIEAKLNPPQEEVVEEAAEEPEIEEAEAEETEE
ncbi:hypothetical protein [Marinomonas transparens]|uniref:Uncharacterized protein n=1 Tax=Marinomonas transparens TaxID=2795388 RepID=A0A934K047_9GAMM|nr:hypothetical protein [Marinomonas transparens]MBJ7540072.1 hypothetical protein [Marinomonas transparens]